MIDEVAAIRAAIGLVRVPSRVHQLRLQALPPGVPLLLRIAAGDIEAEQEAAHWTDESPSRLREAAKFFIEQILLSPESDHYRVLGASPHATSAELRRNMGWLLKGMHPDVEDSVHSVFARRVTAAWNSLKTPDRRRAYDASPERARSDNNVGSKRKSHRLHATKSSSKRGSGTRIAQRHDRMAPAGLIQRILRFLRTGVRA